MFVDSNINHSKLCFYCLIIVITVVHECDVLDFGGSVDDLHQAHFSCGEQHKLSELFTNLGWGLSGV